MTNTQLGATAIRVTAVWWAAAAVVEAVTAGAVLVLPRFGLAYSREFVILNLIGAAIRAGISAACLVFADRVSRYVIKADTPTNITVSAADLLSVGICIVGLVFVASSIPELVQTAAVAFWYAEGTRRVHLAEALRPSARDTVDAGLSLALGIVLTLYSGRIADGLRSRFPTTPEGAR